VNIYVVGAGGSARDLIAAALPVKPQHQVRALKDAVTLFARPESPPDIIFVDDDSAGVLTAEIEQLAARLSDVPIIAMVDGSDRDIVIAAEAAGAMLCLSKTAQDYQLAGTLRTLIRMRELQQQLQSVREAVAEQTQLSQIIARSGSMNTVVHLVEKACKNEINVLLEGEEGTGKEHLARAIHFNGTRANGPFLMLNCVAIPDHLIELEMFGYEAGVFEGVPDSKPGIFELAEGGTLFIDEIGALPLTTQARLYRAMQTRTVRRIGSEQDVPVNVRIVSSTSRNLRTMSADGTFREDLYFRLATFPVKIPPLRDRMVDLPPLAEYFLRKHAENEGRPGLGISKDTYQVFKKYDWPGNARELEHCIARGVVVAESMDIQPCDLPQSILQATGMAPNADEPDGLLNGHASPIPTMEQLKARGIRLALEATGGNIREASRLLDIGRTTMYKLIEKYHIKI